MSKWFLWIFLPIYSVHATAQSREIAIIKKLAYEWNTAFLRKDTSSLGRILADDMIQITGAGDMLTKKDILLKLSDPKRLYKSITIDSILHVEIFENTGIISIKSTVVRVVNDLQSTIKNCYTLVFRKRKGKWTAVQAHFTILNAH